MVSPSLAISRPADADTAREKADESAAEPNESRLYLLNEMPLDQTVLTHTDIGILKAWNGIATTCHFSTIYWLYMTEFDRELTVAKLNQIGIPQNVITQMTLQHGVRIRRPDYSSLRVTPGSVLVFMRNNMAWHSCVAIGQEEVAGYNQVGWWRLGGMDHGFSANQTHQLRWGGDPSRRNKLQKGPDWYELYGVTEVHALTVIRGLGA